MGLSDLSLNSKTLGSNNPVSAFNLIKAFLFLNLFILRIFQLINKNVNVKTSASDV